MKKRFILVILCILISSQLVTAELPVQEQKEEPIENIQTTTGNPPTETPIQNPEYGEGLEYKDFKEADLPNGMKVVSKTSSGVLQTFLNGIYILNALDLLIPDSIEIINPTTITYNIIQSFIIVDSAEEIKLLKPFEMPLKNLGKTKIQLDGNNNVESIETIFNI